MNDYQTVFVYEPSGNNLINLIPILVFLLAGLGVIYYAKKIMKNYSLFRQIILFFGYILAGVATLFLIMALVRIPQMLSNDKDFRNRTETKNYNIVQGETENFSPMPVNGHENEKFTVKGIPFEYSDYVIIKGYHQTSLNNGIITRNGQLVRISYFTIDKVNLIQKIEIKK
jgi:hypothetical protein